MYFEYFGLKRNPFRISPDEDFLYLLEGHKNSLAYLKYTAWANDGFMLLTGEIGTGKTILLKSLIKNVGESIKIINLNQTQLQLDDLLRVILYELTNSFEAASRAELIIRIKENLKERKANKEKVLLIVDEAQNLNKECLEEIRLIADEMYQDENLLNVILSGQPEVEEHIDSFGLEQLKQRIRITYRLTALKEKDLENYVDFRTYIGFGFKPLNVYDLPLVRSNIKQTNFPKYSSLFDARLSQDLYRYTRGIPRLINALCETSLVLAFGERQKKITGTLLNQAIDELGWLSTDDVNEDTASSASLSSQALGTIELSQDGNIIKSVHIEKLPFSIGRGDSNDLVLGNKTVSKRHAVISMQNDVLIISDCNSTNGVKINGLKVVAHVLSNGEIAQIGRYKLRFITNIANNKSESKSESHDTLTTEQLIH